MLHKFLNYDFGNGFQTHEGILDITPYRPEIIIIGTLNHGWSWNPSDFFYGRDMYMWTILGNLFLHNSNHWKKPRTINNNQPTFEELFEICRRGKIAFADIVKGIKAKIQSEEILEKRCVLVNNEYEWGTRKINGNKVGQYSDSHIDIIGKKGWLNDNVAIITNFINNTPSIRHVYFTFKSGYWIVERLKEIKIGIRAGVTCSSIFTPTASGFGKNLPSPYNERVWGLTHCWVWNELEHSIPINRKGFGHLDHEWLLSKGVTPNNF